MSDLIFEQNSFGANPAAKDLTRHLYTRMGCRKVVIVSSSPASLLSALRKQWLKLARKVQKETSRTLDPLKLYELSEIVAAMQGLRFTTKWPPDAYKPADVYITTVEQLLQWAPEADCRTIYITCDLKMEQLHVVAAWIGHGVLIVECKLTQFGQPSVESVR